MPLLVRHPLAAGRGVGYYGLHEELSPEKIKRLVRTNLEAPMILTQQLLRHLKKNAGYIIHISSVTAACFWLTAQPIPEDAPVTIAAVFFIS